MNHSEKVRLGPKCNTCNQVWILFSSYRSHSKLTNKGVRIFEKSLAMRYWTRVRQPTAQAPPVTGSEPGQQGRSRREVWAQKQVTRV